MLTKYTLTIGETVHEIPDECLKNWDEIAFSLKRTDYSGVMRSFSTEFVFVGVIYDLLFAEYLDKGFLAKASVAVYTITNRHEWELQYSAPLDFSTIEIENGTMSINAMDNALASLLKSKKSQKYEYLVSDFSTSSVFVQRIQLSSFARYSFPVIDNHAKLNENYVSATLEEARSLIISKEYIEPCSAVWNTDGAASNRFFSTIVKSGADISVKLTGKVRCWFCPYTKTQGATPGEDTQITSLYVTKLVAADGVGNTERTIMTLLTDNVLFKTIHGTQTNILVNTTKSNVFRTLDALKAEALRRFGNYGQLSNDYNGIFGVVGERDNPSYGTYWQENTVYEYQNGSWINKGAPEGYYQDRNISTEVYQGNGMGSYRTQDDDGAVLCLKITGRLYMYDAEMVINWADPIHSTLTCQGIPPLQLITKIVRSITGEETAVSIEDDDDNLIARTLLLPGEELRQITGAKVYSTFQDFAGWMETVFGYTYRVVDDELQFVHRSKVFEAEVVKTIENYRDLKFSIVDDLIYSSVEIGYPKKEYGEIDGRMEQNFTNYYTTGYDLTDKKLTLQSKYRADSYGVEFTARKSESETKDDKADEDVFFVRYNVTPATGQLNYQPTNNNDFNPSYCVKSNRGFISVLGNGNAVTLTMTSSDGNNAFANVPIAAGEALFTAAVVEFSTEDMVLPEQLNALVQVEHDGYRITGYISEAEARFGRINGVDYKLIVKDITEI